jgi:flagellar basal-body rod modification protein FlgD
MATVPIRDLGLSGTQASGSQGAGGANDALRGLDIDEFLKLMIAELQNQDPLNPLENNEILQQISQIREVGATDKLTKTLDAVLVGQSLSSASAMIGKQIQGLTDDGNRVSGTVDRVTVTDGIPRLHVGARNLGLNNVSEILSGEPA